MFTDLGSEGLASLETATQYPSIPTWHALERGKPTGEVLVEFPSEVDVEITEKIDGANVRIIIGPDESDLPIIGSRTLLLTSLGDLIRNPVDGLVDATIDVATRAHGYVERDDFDDDAYDMRLGFVTVIYGEVYGGGVQGRIARNYTGAQTMGFRLFDVATIDAPMIYRSREELASGRDRGTLQRFWPRHAMETLAAILGVACVPSVNAALPDPLAIDRVHDWLIETLPRSLSTLDDTGTGVPEGVVVRTPNRSHIAKLKHKDYAKVACS